MRTSIDILMERVGCTQWPERWREIYEDAMDVFEREGCPQTDPAYYDALAARYGVLEKELPVYQQAAEQVGQDEMLSRFLHLLCTALSQEETVRADLSAFKAPYSPKEAPHLGKDMLTGLAICSQLPRCAETLQKRGLPQEIITEAMCLPEGAVESYRQRHNGTAGYGLLEWFQLTIEGKLFPMGRLELEVFAGFRGKAWVFRNQSGELVSLAHDVCVHRDGIALGAKGYDDPEGSWQADVQETETGWRGYPHNERGRILPEAITLDKQEWTKVLATGDPVVRLHIPAKGALTEAAVEESLQRMEEFLKTYYPDYHYQAFACDSWLMNPQLADMLGEDTNIAKFCRRFRPLTAKAGGEGVFYFVFLTSAATPLEDLPENTSLERVLKAHYLAGNALHEMAGYFFR